MGVMVLGMTIQCVLLFGAVDARAAQAVALTPYEGTYVGQWRLLNFRSIPYVELSEYLSERELGKRDTLRVEAVDDSTLAVRLQGGGVQLRVDHYKSYVRESSQNVEIFFKAVQMAEPPLFRYRSADGRLQLTFRVVGGAGGYSYLGGAGYSEGDGSLRVPPGILDAQCVVECEGTFDGHALRMQAVLRFVLQRKSENKGMDAKCRGCF